MKNIKILGALLILSCFGTFTTKAFHSSTKSLMSQLEALNIFGLSGTPDEQTIKKTYKTLARQYHPDMPTGNVKKFQEIQNAYEILNQKNYGYPEWMSKKMKEEYAAEIEKMMASIKTQIAQQEAELVAKRAAENAKRAAEKTKRIHKSGFLIASGGVAYLGYNYWSKKSAEKAKEEKEKQEALAKRTYFQKASDSISVLAQSVKANTWDKQLFGYKHGGKVATVTGVTAAVGLVYLAYIKKLFGTKHQKPDTEQ